MEQDLSAPTTFITCSSKYGDEIRIINVDELTYAGNLENSKDVEDYRDNYTFVRADICDSEAITKIFEENDIDRVVHFRGREPCRPQYSSNPEVFVKTNVLGTLVMLNAAKACMGAAGRKLSSRTRNSCMFPQTKYTVPWRTDGGYLL